MGYIKVERFSYSKLNTYKSCGWKYKLTYKDGHYVFSDSLASELGTTLHYIEEQIARSLKNNDIVDYDTLKDMFQNINIPKTSPHDLKGGVYGINLLKEKYKEEFYKPDQNGSSYYTKTLDYLNDGIYRLERYVKDNPQLSVYDMEKYFSVDYNGSILSGYIDRILYNQETDTYIIEDIKTRGKLFDDSDLTTPLQFVIYSYALAQALNIPVEKISCNYDLPFCGVRQPAGTKGFIKRGLKQLDRIFEGIKENNFEPHPTPLCHWCSFCPTNPSQPEEGKLLCPYYSLWTRENKTREVSHEWGGMELHDKNMQDEINKSSQKEDNHFLDEFDFDF